MNQAESSPTKKAFSFKAAYNFFFVSTCGKLSHQFLWDICLEIAVCKCKVSTQHWMILTKAGRLPTMSRETVEPPGDGDGTPPSQRELSFVLEGVGSSMMVYCLGGCQFHIYFVGPNIPWLQILRLQVDKAFLQCHLWQMRLICHSALSWE